MNLSPQEWPFLKTDSAPPLMETLEQVPAGCIYLLPHTIPGWPSWLRLPTYMTEVTKSKRLCVAVESRRPKGKQSKVEPLPECGWELGSALSIGPCYSLSVFPTSTAFSGFTSR